MKESGYMFTCNRCGKKMFKGDSGTPEWWGEYGIIDYQHTKKDDPAKYKRAHIYLCHDCDKDFIEILLSFGGKIE